MSIRDSIFAAADITEETVDVPEWGVTVKVRAMDGAARATFIAQSAGPDGRIDPVKGYPSLLIATLRDPETDEPVFTAPDRDALMAKNGAVIDRVADVALRLCGLLPGAAEDAAKNSSAPLSGASTSSLPSA